MAARRQRWVSPVVGLVALSLGPTGAIPVPPAAAATPIPVVFDTDMDFDDAAALAYLSQEHKKGRIQLRAVTVTNSGVGLPGFAIRNARCLLRRFGLSHVPVADGSPTAVNVAPPEARLTVELVLTTVLLGCLEGTQPAPMSAAQLLADSIRSAPSNVTLIATGPLSNVAGALRSDPALAGRVAAAYVMGGAVHVPGNLCCTTTAGFDNSQELNMWIDPQAARDAFGSLRENFVSLVALDATRHVPLTAPFAARLQSDQKTPEAQLVAAIANHPVVTLGSLIAPAYWWDPLAAMAATRPGVVRYQAERIVVVQDGAQSGRTAPSANGRGVHVGVFADQVRFEQLFLDTLNGRAA